MQWLADNGAVFPKLQWPAVTATGHRGVVALAAIATNEPMVQVPAELVISEQRCWQDPQLQRVLEANRDVFSRDDPVLALFLVREMLKGDASFFEPYLSILPYPESIQDWTDDELSELHDRCVYQLLILKTLRVRQRSRDAVHVVVWLRAQTTRRRCGAPSDRDRDVLRPRLHCSRHQPPSTCTSFCCV